MLQRGAIRPGVVALSSGFMTYRRNIHPEYWRVRCELEQHSHTFVLLPSCDRDVCVAETVRRQIARPFGRASAKEEAVIRLRFEIYMSLPVRKIETMGPVGGIVAENRIRAVAREEMTGKEYHSSAACDGRLQSSAVISRVAKNGERAELRGRGLARRVDGLVRQPSRPRSQADHDIEIHSVGVGHEVIPRFMSAWHEGLDDRRCGLADSRGGICRRAWSTWSGSSRTCLRRS